MKFLTVPPACAVISAPFFLEQTSLQSNRIAGAATSMIDLTDRPVIQPKKETIGYLLREGLSTRRLDPKARSRIRTRADEANRKVERPRFLVPVFFIRVSI
jgi:hypothetical protein